MHWNKKCRITFLLFDIFLSLKQTNLHSFEVASFFFTYLFSILVLNLVFFMMLMPSFETTNDYGDKADVAIKEVGRHLPRLSQN